MHHQAFVTSSDPQLLLNFRGLLGGLGYLVESAPICQPPSHSFSVAVVDIRRRDSLQRMQSLAARGLVLALIDPDQDALARMHGADETLLYIDGQDPLSPHQLAESIEAGKRRLGRPIDGPLGQIIGRSAALCHVLARIERYAVSSSTVLITGDTGTGKELAARALHLSSPRTGGPFVPVNCAAIPESLAESEIFGHARGSFTGANAQRPGLIAAAEGGTLFLDEIGELGLPIQAKLLRVLQEREYTPIGENLPRRANVRIIAATNRDLHREVQSGRFRADLYWRLEMMSIELPPLSDRMEDVLPISHHVIDRTNHAQGLTVAGMSPKVVPLLRAHDWSGNIRELENTIERAVILRGQGELEEDDIILRRRLRPAQVLEHIRLPPDGLDLTETTAALELLLIEQALEQVNGNRAAAARLLNINRTTLIQKMRRKEDPR